MTEPSAIQHRQQRRVRLIGIALVNIATFTWATNMVLGRSLREDIGPLTLAAARFLVASLIFAVLLRQRPAPERRPGLDRWLLVAMAITGVVMFSPMLYLGLRFTTAINATLINSMGPLLTGMFAALLIQEPMTKRQLAGAVAGLVGVALLISQGSLALWEIVRGNQGDFIVLGAVTLWALYSVLGRQVMRHRSALSATALTAFIGLPFLAIAAVIELQTHPVHTRPELFLAILYIGFAPTLIGFSAWNAGVRRLGASGAMVFYNTLPLYGALLGHLFLGESIGTSHLLGGALIIGGGLWAARGNI